MIWNGGRFSNLLWVVVCASVVTLASGRADCASTTGRADVSQPTEPPSSGTHKALQALPLQFDSEVVRLFVAEDSLEVEGIYRLLCRRTNTPYASLFYPYPADSLLGGARTVLLECRSPGDPWQTLPFEEIPARHAARWRIPLDLGPELEVRTLYRQALNSGYARYIVTTTQAWGRPLRHARFEIYLPTGAEPQRFSFPFERQEADGKVFYLYEAEDFLPDRDIVVEWTVPP